MMADVQYYDGSNWISLSYSNFEIHNGDGRNLLAPTAKIRFAKDVNISANDEVRIQFKGDTRFEGFAKSSGQYDANGRKIYEVRGYGYEIMEEEISVNLSSTTAHDVLIEAVSGTSYTVTHPSADVSISEYDATAQRKKIFRDMMNRTGYIIRITPDKVIHFESESYRGNNGSIDVQNDKAAIIRWEEDDLDTVINSVTVVGTNDNRRIEGTASNSTSVSDYGERNKKYNVGYITDQSEADSLASSLLKPNPLDSGKVRVSGNLFNSSNVVNFDYDVIDSGRSISSTVVVKEQIIYDQYMELKVGSGEDFAIDERNRNAHSSQDKSKSGGQWSDIYDDGGMPQDNATQNKTFLQSSPPSGQGESEGDIWIDSDTGSPYVYDGSDWQRTVWEDVSSDPDAPENNATKNELIRQSTEPDPNNYEDGDMWVDSDNGNPYIHDGSDWQRTTWDTIRDDPDAPDDNADQTSDNLGTWTYDEWLSKIDADHYFDGNVIVNGSIGANEIAANSITAEEIDTLNLDTGDLTVGDNQTYSIETQQSYSTDDTSLYPSTDGTCTLGLNDKAFLYGYFTQILTDSITTLDDSRIDIFADVYISDLDGNIVDGTTFGDGYTYYIEVGESDDFSSETTLEPNTDLTCNIGNSSYRYNAVYADEHLTSSPKRFNGDPLKNIQSYSVDKGLKKDLPGYVKKKSLFDRRREELEDELGRNVPDSEVEEHIRDEVRDKLMNKKRRRKKSNSKKEFDTMKADADLDNVSLSEEEIREELNKKKQEHIDLGAMTSWLLEQNKAQQERIDNLEDKVDKLEKRLDKIEGNNKAKNK